MLNGLDQVDWENISHSHGKATDFPRWLRELTSDDRPTRQNALEALWEYSNHQGSIYQVTEYVIPFLIELLQADHVQDKSDILGMMASITRNCRWDVELSRHGGNERQTLENVKEGLPVYIDLLTHTDPHVRFLAFELIVAQKEVLWDRPVLKDLRAAIVQERVPDIKADMITSWCHFLSFFYLPLLDLHSEQYNDAVALLTALMEPSEPDLVRYHAALALLDYAWNTVEIPGVMVDIFKDAVIDPDKYARTDAPSSTRNIVKGAVDGLRFLHLDRRIDVLAEVLPQIRHPEDAHDTARALLDLVFYGFVRPMTLASREIKGPVVYYQRLPDDYPAERPDNSQMMFRTYSWESPEEARLFGRLYSPLPTKRDVKTLTAEQRRVLSLVIETDLPWMLHSNMLEMYGLPVYRHDVRAMLEGD